jgi:heme exporter protein CcmD
MTVHNAVYIIAAWGLTAVVLWGLVISSLLAWRSARK